MFNLEQAISAWRQQMLATGIQAPVPLEELESHLRDEIEQHLKSGLPGQRAFEISVPHIGPPELLKKEFKKCERPFMKLTTEIIAGIVGLGAGAALQIPGSLQLRDELVMANGRFGLWLLGWLLVVWSLQQFIRPKGFQGKIEKAALTAVKPSVLTGAGIIVLLIGAALMLPAAAQVCAAGLIRFEALCGMTFGIALLLAGWLVTFRPYEKRKA